MKALFTDDEIMIYAPTAKVWDALVNPEMTKKYMYGCEVICNWNVDDPIIWKGAADGVEYVKGKLLALDEGELFIYTVIDPLGKYSDIPENYLTVKCLLRGVEGGCKLRVTQGDYNLVADGAERYAHAIEGGGWSTVLESIKKLVE